MLNQPNNPNNHNPSNPSIHDPSNPNNHKPSNPNNRSVCVCACVRKCVVRVYARMST
jgi:hypothetical protein